MKLEIEILQREYENVLSGYAALLTFRFVNLCVKAEPAALLPAAIMVKGEEKKLEEVAQVGVKSDDQMDVYPFHEDLIMPIGKAVMEIHPEFKQSLETIHVETQNKDMKFLRLTMPEVNGDRRDVLNTGVEAFFNEAKTQSDQSKAKYLQRLAKEIYELPKDEMDEARSQFDMVYDNHVRMIGHLVDEKKQEIEEAYQRYLQKKQEAESLQQEQADAEGREVTTQMRMEY
ncbi:MAG: ribosome recycling factor [Prevotella sp.]|nr:ribosome recycling factor [Prevotella sp.]